MCCDAKDRVILLDKYLEIYLKMLKVPFLLRFMTHVRTDTILNSNLRSTSNRRSNWWFFIVSICVRNTLPSLPRIEAKLEVSRPLRSNLAEYYAIDTTLE